MSHALTFVIPFYENDQRLTEQVKAIIGQTLPAEILLFDERLRRETVPAVEEALATPNVRYLPRGHRNRAALFNDGCKNAAAPLCCVLPPDIVPRDRFAAAYTQAFADAAAGIAYSDYDIEELGAGVRVEKLWPFQNNLDERFSLGFVRVYRKKLVEEAGYFNEDLNYAEEYDFRLRVQTSHKVVHLAEPLYRTLARDARPADPALSKLYSPGQGNRGGFSYLFYTPEMEREIEFVFKQHLQRIGAFLTHPNEEVSYAAGAPFDLMVSVVIPILNRRTFIRHTIERVLRGTFQDFEILVVDNGSTDGTQEEVAAIDDSRVRLIQNDGSCIAEALNRGIREARGKYIAQLDSDDEYTPDTLETMVAYMECHPKCGLAISYYDLIDAAGNPIPELGIIKHLEYDRNNILRVDGAGALRFFHKKVLEEFGLYNVDKYGNFGEDYDMVLKISEKYDVDRVHKVLYRYRRHPDNTDVQRPAAMKIYNKNNARQDALLRRLSLNRRHSA